MLTQGKSVEALKPLSDSYAGYAALAAFDSANPERRRLLANAHRLLGTLALERTDAAEAMREGRAGSAMMEALVTTNPTNALYQYNFSRMLTLLGAGQLASSHAADAEATENRALAIITPALAKKPSDINLRVASTEANLELGDARARAGNASGATAAWTAALGAIDSLAKSRQFTDHLALRAAALVRLGRIDEARPVVTEVLRRGYRRPRWMAFMQERQVVPAS
jgi:tetratricopeptide (TPR) repeat protein